MEKFLGSMTSSYVYMVAFPTAAPNEILIAEAKACQKDLHKWGEQTKFRATQAKNLSRWFHIMRLLETISIYWAWMLIAAYL